MEIRDAMKQVVAHRKVQREGWDARTYVFHNNEEPGYPYVAVDDNDPIVYEPSFHDLLARDWVVLRHIEVPVPEVSVEE